MTRAFVCYNFIRRDLGGYPLCLAHVLFFWARFFSCGSFARVSVCDGGVLRSASVRNFTHGYRQSAVKLIGNA